MIGYITSGCYSQLVQAPLCFAWIDSDVPRDAPLLVSMRNERVPAKVLPKPPAAPRNNGDV